MSAIDHIPGNDSLLELPRMLRDPISFLRERHAQFGDVFRSRLLFPVVFVVGPEANHTLHITKRDHVSYKEGYGTIAFGRLFEGSLILEDGAEHKRDRDVLQPAVSRLGLGKSLERVQAIWTRAADRLAAQPVVDAYRFAREVTFDVSANALVDLELEELDEWRGLFEQLVTGAMANTKLRVPLGKLDRGLRARDELIARLVPRIEAARQREPRGMVGRLAHHKGEDGAPLSARRIAEHVLLLFWAGYDTTASTGAWVLTDLAMRTEWQHRLWREQQEVLGTRDLALEDMDRLVELGWFLKEIERHRPVVVFFPRMVKQPLEIGGVTVPPGTMLFWTPYMTHHAARVFPDPDRFDPERFRPERADRDAPSGALIGFGSGPRICLGKSFALVQLRVLVTTLLRRFTLSLENGPEVRRLVLPTHRPLDARIRFTPR